MNFTRVLLAIVALVSVASAFGPKARKFDPAQWISGDFTFTLSALSTETAMPVDEHTRIMKLSPADAGVVEGHLFTEVEVVGDNETVTEATGITAVRFVFDERVAAKEPAMTGSLYFTPVESLETEATFTEGFRFAFVMSEQQSVTFHVVIDGKPTAVAIAGPYTASGFLGTQYVTVTKTSIPPPPPAWQRLLPTILMTGMMLLSKRMQPKMQQQMAQAQNVAAASENAEAEAEAEAEAAADFEKKAADTAE